MTEKLVYDAIIALLVGTIPVYLVSATLRARQNKGTGPGVIGALLLLVWITVVYGSFIEPRLLTVRRYEVRIGPGKRVLTAGVISDAHLGGYRHREWLAKVVARLNAERPDVVLLAGDMVSSERGLQELAPLGGIRAPLGAYAALGNWDYHAGAVDVRHGIEAQGVEVLTNEHVTLPVGGETVVLGGIDDMRYGDPDIDETLAGAPRDVPTILLTHNPDATPLAESRGVDLVIAGHTHGGQVRLPYFGAVPRLPISIGQHFDRGLFEYGPTRLFITPGIGESGPRARLFVPPEISIIRIVF